MYGTIPIVFNSYTGKIHNKLIIQIKILKRIDLRDSKWFLTSSLLTLPAKLGRQKKLLCCRHYWDLSVFCSLQLPGMCTTTFPYLLEDGVAMWLVLANVMQREIPCAVPKPKHLVPPVLSLLQQTWSLMLVVPQDGWTSISLGPGEVTSGRDSPTLCRTCSTSKNATLLF